MTLENTAWQLADFGDGAPLADPGKVTLNFTTRDDGSTGVAGSGGCNRFMASCTITDDTVTFGPLGSTRMMCDPATNEVETRYFRALASASHYERDGDDLIVETDEGKLRFTPSVA